MPYFDGTGPVGRGPMTGRGMGYCNPANRSGYVGGFGRGFRRAAGFRRGFGFRCGYPGWPQYNMGDEKEVLLQQKRLLEQDLKSVSELLDKYDEKSDEE